MKHINIGRNKYCMRFLSLAMFPFCANDNVCYHRVKKLVWGYHQIEAIMVVPRKLIKD